MPTNLSEHGNVKLIYCMWIKIQVKQNRKYKGEIFELISSLMNEL